MHRLAAAIGGAVALVLTAFAADALAGLIGGPRGVFAGVLVCGAVFGVCGLVFRQPRHDCRLHPPAPARLPERARDDLAPRRAA